jgi:CheY-like chemotaxis protein
VILRRQPKIVHIHIASLNLRVFDPEGRVLGWLSFHAHNGELFIVNPDFALKRIFVFRAWLYRKHVQPTARTGLAAHERVLQSSGYETATGFDALLQLKRKLPAIVISDLNMPEMSGFELLSVVRQQFPRLSLVAMGGLYESGDEAPGGVIADALYPKGNPGVLLLILSEMLSAPGVCVDEKLGQAKPTIN